MAQKQVGSASIAITKLLNGTNQYIFIRYSANSNGNPMTEKPVSGTKYMGVYTSTQNVASVDYNDYSWALFKGQDGESTVSGVLTDEFITVNTDSDGNNGDFSKATTSIMLFEGLVENTSEWKVQVTTESGVNGTYNSDTATYKVTSLTVDTGTITFTATKDGSTVIKNATVQKIKPGADGVDGVGVDSTIIEYQKSAIGDKIPTGSWSTVLPTLVKGDFIWTRTTINFTDNSSSISYTVGFIGFDGDDGNPGNDGNGIEKTEIHYQSGSSGTTVPSGTWSLEIPEVAQTQYLWTRTRITYTDQMTSTSYSVGRMGEQGPKGDPAKLLYLSVSSNVMQFNSNNQAIAQTINIAGNLQNVTGTVNFVATPYIGSTAQTPITLGGSGNNRTLTSAQWNATWEKVVIKATLGSLTDTQTIVKIKEAKDGIAGEDGLGITNTAIKYAQNTSGITPPTTGWGIAVPSLVKGQYLWTQTTWTYTDSSTEVGYSVSYNAKDGNDGEDGIAGKDGVGITSTLVEYAGFANGTVPPTSGWTTNVPAVSEGKYLWTKTTWTYSDNTKEVGYSVAYMGISGTNGKDGIAGKDGLGIKSTIVAYQGSTNGTTPPTGTWSSSVPTVAKGSYLWTRTIWTYTDNTSETGYSVAYMGTNGNDGTNGVAGKDGVGITSTTITYAKSTSGTTAPTSGYTSTVPTVPEGQYLWTKTEWTYSDKTKETGYSVAKMGKSGVDGEDAIVGLVTNETISLPATSAGAVSDFSKATGSFKVYEGLTEIKTGVTYAVKTSVSATGAINTSGVYTISALSADSGSITLTAIYKGVVIEKVITLSKSKAGTNGSSAQLLHLTATSEIMRFDANDSPIGSQSIDITAKLQNVSGNATFRAIPYIGTAAQTAITLDGTANVRTLTSAKWTNKEWTAISVTASLGSLTDTITISKIREGGDGQTSHTHIGYSWSPDGTDRFTKVYPGDNLLLGTLPNNWPTLGSRRSTGSAVATLGDEKVLVTASGDTPYYFAGAFSDKQILSDEFIAKIKGKRLVASVDLAFVNQLTVPANNLGISIYYWREDGRIFTPSSRKTIAGNERIWIDALIPEDVVNVLVAVRGYGYFVNGASFEFDNLKLEIVDAVPALAPIYTPAPSEDYENAYPKYQGIYSDFNKEQSLDPTRYTWTRIMGESNIVGLLTNEAITVSANAAGSSVSTSSVSGTFKVYDGLIDVTSKATFTVEAQTNGVFAIDAKGVYSMSSMSQANDTSTATLTATYKGVTIEKVLTVTKSKTGNAGADSTSYWLLLSSQVLSVPKGTTTLVPANFTVTPMKQTGTAAAAAFSARIIIDETTDGTTWANKYSGDSAAYTYTPSSANIRAVRVQMKLNASSVLLDQKSVNIVTDGINGAPGQDGSSSYTWIRYSENANGNPMTTIPNKESRYIGIAITSSNIVPTSYAAYTWMRMKGDGGLKTKLYTESGANINDQPVEIFNEAQSDGDVVEPEDLIWSVARESSQTWSPLGSHDHPNYAVTTSQEWSKPFTGFSGVANTCPSVSRVDIDESWQVGDKILVYLEYKYDNIVAASGQTAKCWTQGSGNVTAWDAGAFSSSARETISGSGTLTFKYYFTLSAASLTNQYWSVALRHDYVQSGSVQWKLLKVEKSTSGNGDDFTGWTPYLEGTAADIPIYYDYNINLLSGTAIEASMDSNAPTSSSIHDLYKFRENKTLSELGYKVGDKITTSFKWNINKIGTTDMTYGTLKVEWVNKSATYVDGRRVATFSATNTNGEVRVTQTLNAAILEAVQLRLRIDNSVLKFTLANVKVEPGDKKTPWVPLLEELDGILIKQNSIIVSPNAFLNENSLSFRSEVYYQTMKAMDQMTITNKAFDAMRPLILRQPVAPRDPYPGLLWMDTSSDDNYIYRWGKTPREVVDGVKYTHYAYANQLDPEVADFTVYYPNRNLWVEKGYKNGFITTDGGLASSSSVFNMVQDNYIPVPSNYTNVVIQTFNPNKTTNSVAIARVAFYTEDKTFIQTKEYTLMSGKEKDVFSYAIPTNTKYIRANVIGGSNTGDLSLDPDLKWKIELSNGENTIYLPSPEDDKDNAYMNFIGTYEDKIEKDSTAPSDYHWTTLNDKENHKDSSGNKGISLENIVTVYDWGWILLTQDEKEGIPWLNNEDGSTMIDWIYQITQNTSDSSIINKVVGSEQMKDIYASSDDLNELVGSNQELAEKMEEYNQLMQDYANDINALYSNMTEMKQTMDKFLFNIESAGGVNIIKNSTGFQFDDQAQEFYQWTKSYMTNGTAVQEMGNQTLNDLGFVAGFRLEGYRAVLNQDIILPHADIEYTLSAYMSCIGNKAGASKVIVKIINPDNGADIARFSNEGVDIETMERFSVTFNSPVDKVRLRIMLWSDDSATTTVKASALVAGTMLNIGPFPLSWQSHHEEVYSTNVRMDGSGLKVFNNDYDGYNVMTPREFAGYYKEGDQYEKVFTLNKDTTEVKKLQAEERFMMKPIQIVSIDSPVTPGWAFVPYDNDDAPTWNPNLLYNITIPQVDSDKVYWPQPRDTPEGPWVEGNVSKPENTVFRVTSDGTYATYRFGTQNLDNVNLPYRIGNTYTLSVDLRGNIPSGTQLNFCCEYRTTSAGWATVDTRENIPLTGAFQRFSFTRTVPLNTTRFYLGVQIFTSSGASTPIPASAYFDMRAPKLEIGSIMTL